MKSHLLLLLLFLTLSTSCQNKSSKEAIVPETKIKDMVPTLEKATVVSYQNIDVKKFNQGSKEEVGAVIIDVRTPEEVAMGKIPGALEINYFDSDFLEQILALEKEKPYYMYCKVGGRSAKAARLMINNGFTKVYNLDGGYTKWSGQ